MDDNKKQKQESASASSYFDSEADLFYSSLTEEELDE